MKNQTVLKTRFFTDRKCIPRVENTMAKIKDFLNIEHCTNPVNHNSVYKSHWLVTNLCVEQQTE